MAIRAFLRNTFHCFWTTAKYCWEKRAEGKAALAYEGQLLRGKRTAPVYKIQDGRKRWIVTEAVFLRHGFSRADVRVVPQATVDKIPSGNYIT